MKSDIKILFIVIIYGPSFDILEKRKKWGHQTYYLAGGPKLSPPLQISRILKKLRSVIFVIFIIPYFLYDVILHYKRKKEREKKNNLFKVSALESTMVLWFQSLTR